MATPEMIFPIERKPEHKRGKRLAPKPGQTVGLCDICVAYRVFDFTPALTCRCTDCSWEVRIEDVG